MLATCACALLASAALAETKDNATKPFLYGPDQSAFQSAQPQTIDQQINALTPEQKSRFDSERSRILAKIGRGPDGKLLASNSSDEEKPLHHRRHHHRADKSHLAKRHVKKSDKTGLAENKKLKSTTPDTGALAAPLPGKTDIKDTKLDKSDKIEKTDKIEKSDKVEKTDKEQIDQAK